MDFAALTDHWVKLKEAEKRDKCEDLARKQKKLTNMEVTVILFTQPLRSGRIWRKVNF